MIRNWRSDASTGEPIYEFKYQSVILMTYRIMKTNLCFLTIRCKMCVEVGKINCGFRGGALCLNFVGRGGGGHPKFG